MPAAATMHLHPSPRSVPSLNGAHLSISIIVSLCPLQVVFHSPSQQHGFNFPFQIGSFDSMSDSPSQAQRFSVPVEVRTVFSADFAFLLYIYLLCFETYSLLLCDQ